MVFNTAIVGLAVTPTVTGTIFSHYLNRKPLRQKPTAHISYDVGLHLIRRFLVSASNHTIEEIQGFTTRGVPNPRWVRVEDIEVPEQALSTAATHIQAQLGPDGVEAVGGTQWWQWRHDRSHFRAEWIEMRKDYNARQKSGEKCQRCMMYVHGGAYYFGSVDEHRYQMQRHARKLKARVFAPRYRLAPQFPFPCGLQDCLAAYLHLLTIQEPETIVLAGDSAGGGMLVSLMVILRDQGLPMPAGAILLSPWVDLTHSFPSVAGDNTFDYVPPYGFIHRPSPAWPPPNVDELETLENVVVRSTDGEEMTLRDLHIQEALKARKSKAPQPSITINATAPAKNGEEQKLLPKDVNTLNANLNGQKVVVKDQIQIYTTNRLISHPLVSPILQPTLGGLPPILILVGGGEMLRDEQIYLAHKMADPKAYPAPSSPFSSPSLDSIDHYRPTNVQLQVWDDLCHVAATLSFTRPAKYMYRSVAQFGAWALARAQKTEIRILDDDEISIISSISTSSISSEASSNDKKGAAETDATPTERKTRRDRPAAERRKSSRKAPADPKNIQDPSSTIIGKAGDPLPNFDHSMIRQRVSRHGEITALAPPSELPACTMAVADIGAVKPGPVRKWLRATGEWNNKFARQKRNMAKLRMADAQAGGYEIFVNESGDGLEAPPPTALAGRRRKGVKVKEPSKKISRGLAMWTAFGSKHDETTLEREEDKEKDQDDAPEEAAVVGETGVSQLRKPATSKSRSRMRSVTDAGQTGDHDTWAATQAGVLGTTAAGIALGSTAAPNGIENSDNTDAQITRSLSKRAAIGGAAVPFKLAPPLGTEHENASVMTLQDKSGVVTPIDEVDVPRTQLVGSEDLPGERPGLSERFVTAHDDLPTVPGGWMKGSSEEGAASAANPKEDGTQGI